MSNQEENQQPEVNITKEDTSVVREFMNHFNMEIPAYVNEVLKTMDKADTLTPEHQNELKIALARMLVDKRDESIIADELFNDVIANCEKVWFDKQFEEDFETHPVEDTTTSKD